MRKEQWDDAASNADQQYLTHGVFRYFGKLPPTLTGRILDELSVQRGMTVVDVMCGSGTTIIEATLRGASAIGIDCNNLSVLISKVKTKPIANSRYIELEKQFRSRFADALLAPEIDEAPNLFNGQTVPFYSNGFESPKIANLDHWFAPKSVELLSRLKSWLAELPEDDLSDLAKVAFASSIRPCSRASVRTGRLFVDVDKVLPNPMIEFSRRLKKTAEAVSHLLHASNWNNLAPEIRVADARATGLPSELADVVFCHPPYFALYRYSSDVLRFELDWMGISRKAIAALEIEDGFKTSDETLVNDYLIDMERVAGEARRLAKKNGKFVAVTADSTLRKQRLSILEPLIDSAAKHGWKLERRIIRKVRFAQASYHRSFDSDIHRPDDEILIFSAF